MTSLCFRSWQNFVLGLCVALMALTFDMTLLSWAEAKKKVLGLD
jgi:glycine betaine/proline transport system permease protein